MQRFSQEGRPIAAAMRERRPVWFGGSMSECPVYSREGLDVGHEVAGPAIIEQYDCTIVIEPGQLGRVDAFKNIVVTR
jgi:N-methylhydantoinase A